MWALRLGIVTASNRQLYRLPLPVIEYRSVVSAGLFGCGATWEDESRASITPSPDHCAHQVECSWSAAHLAHRHCAMTCTRSANSSQA